jgi:hypothetical protein
MQKKINKNSSFEKWKKNSNFFKKKKSSLNPKIKNQILQNKSQSNSQTSLEPDPQAPVTCNAITKGDSNPLL